MARCILSGKGGHNGRLVKMLFEANSMKQVFTQKTMQAYQIVKPNRDV